MLKLIFSYKIGPLSRQACSNNIKRLLGQQLIKLIASKAGINRSEKFYQITGKGEYLWENTYGN